VEYFNEIGADSVRSVTRVEGVHHPYWMFKRDENGVVVPAVDGVSIEEYYQSQLLPPVFRLNGVVDVISKEVVLNTSLPLYGRNMEVFELEESVSVDIDTEEDFKYCEWLMQQK
jgi:CMP-N-acetylneuraminic acid synthetase